MAYIHTYIHTYIYILFGLVPIETIQWTITITYNVHNSSVPIRRLNFEEWGKTGIPGEKLSIKREINYGNSTDAQENTTPMWEAQRATWTINWSLECVVVRVLSSSCRKLPDSESTGNTHYSISEIKYGGE